MQLWERCFDNPDLFFLLLLLLLLLVYSPFAFFLPSSPSPTTLLLFRSVEDGE
jgi:hypothetical protein